MGYRLETAESVTDGHPDKVCDQISDGILDACLQQDPMSRVAVETLASGNTVVLAGELTTSAKVDVADVARTVIGEIGYTDPALGFDRDGCFILQQIRHQSPDIAQGVDGKEGLGAGDQGVFYGYACDETPTFMPAPSYYAHRLSYALSEGRKSGALPWARPDGKTQVTLARDSDGKTHLTSVIVSAQHDPSVSRERLVRDVLEQVVVPVLGPLLRKETRVLINPTGRFVEGGPAADTGLTGRKLMVDTYGGLARHGGGAFSGKDATKVDRTAAYMARHIAKNVVAARLAKRCEISLAFAIGQTRPEMVSVEDFGTGHVDLERLVALIRDIFPLSVSGMIQSLGLREPRFRLTAAHGHFGRPDVDAFPWERIEYAHALRAGLGCGSPGGDIAAASQ